MPTRPKIFKWRQTEPVLILCAVRWYLRYSLSLRDVEELLEERGLEADHTAVWRWVQRYGNKSWRVDETHLRVKGRWCYLGRSIPRVPPSISYCRHCAMPMPPNGCFATRAIYLILNP